MDLEDVEDMLFSASDSQESFDNLCDRDFHDDQILDVADNEYEFDDDLFDAPLEVTDSWQLLSSPLLTSADASIAPRDDLLMGESGTYSLVDAVLPMDMGKRISRDR